VKRNGSTASLNTRMVILQCLNGALKISRVIVCCGCNEFKMIKVAFICVHNSCRSQIAEALGRHLAGDTFESYSAGTETKPKINQDAVRLMKQLYGIDMEATQYSKLLSELPPVDIVVTMGCNVECPNLPCKHREDWGITDPTGKSDEEFTKVISIIETRILELKKKLM
jgi:arsenate reductase